MQGQLVFSNRILWGETKRLEIVSETSENCTEIEKMIQGNENLEKFGLILDESSCFLDQKYALEKFGCLLLPYSNFYSLSMSQNDLKSPIILISKEDSLKLRASLASHSVSLVINYSIVPVFVKISERFSCSF